MKNFEPNELVKIKDGVYSTKSHDSLRIEKNIWHRFSTGDGGKNALQYLINVEGYKFQDAVKKLYEKPIIYDSKIDNEDIKNKSEKKLILPPKASNNELAKQYLISRGIDKEIIEECIRNKLIYEEKNYHNVVFIGYDKNKIPRYAFCRATNENRFMRDSKGSNKNYTFRLNSVNKSERVHLFESAIDLLSYATLIQMKNGDFHNENLLSLAGVSISKNNEKENKIPNAIKNFLNENSNIKEIFLHLDNDEVGRNATEKYKKILEKEYKIFDRPPPSGKDCNDYLCYVLGLKNFKKYTKENNKKCNVR